MTQEDKELLFKDLSARLPYGVICVGVTYDLDDDGERYIPVKVRNILTEINNYTLETASVKLDLISSCKLETIKPYLRSMSSMTEEEIREFTSLVFISDSTSYSYLKECILFALYSAKALDWLNTHHFDYHDLIGKGLALEAPEGMYGEF